MENEQIKKSLNEWLFSELTPYNTNYFTLIWLNELLKSDFIHIILRSCQYSWKLQSKILIGFCIIYLIYVKTFNEEIAIIEEYTRAYYSLLRNQTEGFENSTGTLIITLFCFGFLKSFKSNLVNKRFIRFLKFNMLVYSALYSLVE